MECIWLHCSANELSIQLAWSQNTLNQSLSISCGSIWRRQWNRLKSLDQFFWTQYYWFHFRVAKCQRSNNNAAQWRCHECFWCPFFPNVLLLLFGIGLGLHDPSLSLKLNIYCRMDIIGTSQPKGALVIKVYTVCIARNETNRMYFMCIIYIDHEKCDSLCVVDANANANAYEKGVQETHFSRSNLWIRTQNRLHLNIYEHFIVSNMIQNTEWFTIWWCYNSWKDAMTRRAERDFHQNANSGSQILK